ncbi:MAG TPA: hypothetical protein VKM93_19100 [Terriglobia bacterium]|nr:hypothetical protein [Terriglobia bacterium]
MRTITRVLFAALLFSQFSSAQQPVFRPGSREAAKAEDRNEVPPQIKAKAPGVDPAKLKSEADELLKRAQSIPAAIDQVTKGQLPSDLSQQLKEIEKLAKQLRRQITP